MTETEQKKGDTPREFIRSIRSVCWKVPGARQTLARSLGDPANAVQAFRYLPMDILTSRFEDKRAAYLTVAGLIAKHDPKARGNVVDNDPYLEGEVPDEEPEGGDREARLRRENLGGILGAIDAKKGQIANGQGPCGRRMHRLLQRDLGGFHKELPRLVGLVVGEGHHPNWVILLKDTAPWDRPDSRKETIRRWSYSYYRHTLKEEKS